MTLVLHELQTQQLLFWRNREAAFFSFVFPILLLLIGSVYGDNPIEGKRPDLPPDRAARLRSVCQRLRLARHHPRRPARGRAPQAGARDASGRGRISSP